MEGQRATSRDLLSSGDSWGQPAHVAELYRLWLANTEAMIGWLEQELSGRRATHCSN